MPRARTGATTNASNSSAAGIARANVLGVSLMTCSLGFAAPPGTRRPSALCGSLVAPRWAVPGTAPDGLVPPPGRAPAGKSCLLAQPGDRPRRLRGAHGARAQLTVAGVRLVRPIEAHLCRRESGDAELGVVVFA